MAEMVAVRNSTDVLVSVDGGAFRSIGYLSGIKAAMAWADENAGDARTVAFHRVGTVVPHPAFIHLRLAEIGPEMAVLERG